MKQNELDQCRDTALLITSKSQKFYFRQLILHIWQVVIKKGSLTDASDVLKYLHYKHNLTVLMIEKTHVVSKTLSNSMYTGELTI